MKKLVLGGFVALSVLVTPLAPVSAQVATSTDPVVQDQLDSLRQELIGLLMKLITQLQAQLDAEVAKNVVQDDEIKTIKSSGTQRVAPVIEDTTTSESIDDVRKRVGTVRASASISEEDEGEYFVLFSIDGFLDVDDVSYSASVDPVESDGGCNSISDSDYKVCGVSAMYPIASSTEVSITAVVNGQKKVLNVSFEDKRASVTWPSL